MTWAYNDSRIKIKTGVWDRAEIYSNYINYNENNNNNNDSIKIDANNDDDSNSINIVNDGKIMMIKIIRGIIIKAIMLLIVIN